MVKIFQNDFQIKKKVVSKLGKKTANSSSSWCNSPEYHGFKTLHQILEGVKKKFFIKITRLFLIFRDWCLNISRFFHEVGVKR